MNPTEPTEKAIGVIENVLYQTQDQDDGNFFIGDIFLEKSIATYIVYNGGFAPGGLAYGIAGAVGGVVGILSVPNKDLLNKILPSAKEHHFKDWGLPINERVKKGLLTISF